MLPSFYDFSPRTGGPASTLPSFMGLVVAFYVLAPRFPNEKQASWIITTISSATMTLASVPFLWTYLANGASVQDVGTFEPLAVPANRFFQAYLVADLVVGSRYYRSRISFLEGWIHHVTYVFIVECAVRRSWAHIFCLGASMEIPTFILGIAVLFPKTRNNTIFAASFFLTRIFFHVVLGISYIFEHNRVQATNGSFIPALCLGAVLPLHVMWFVGCIKGFIRRANQKEKVDISSWTPQGAPRMRSTETHTSVSPARSLRIRLSHRRQSFEKALQSLQVEFPDLQILNKETIANAVSAYLPHRQVLYEYVGLGGKRKRVTESGSPRHRFAASM